MIHFREGATNLLGASCSRVVLLPHIVARGEVEGFGTEKSVD